MHISDHTASTATGAGTPARSSVISSDFQTFLVMLTTQMQNQDPLNPIESSDFAVQLATFSGVEQQVRTNDLLNSMLANSGIEDLSSWVGLEARIEGPVRFDGGPVLLDLGAEVPGATRQLVIRDTNGTTLGTESIPVGARDIEWAGLDASRRPLPIGRYELSVQHLRDGEVVSTTPVASYSGVVEARRTPSGTELLLRNGDVVDAGEVDAVRSA